MTHSRGCAVSLSKTLSRIQRVNSHLELPEYTTTFAYMEISENYPCADPEGEQGS